MELDNLLQKIEKNLSNRICNVDDAEYDVGVIIEVLTELIEFIKKRA